MAFIRADFFSKELEMNTSIQVIMPDDVDNSKVNVLYLLHGLSDNCTGWYRLTSIERYANEYKLAVVMPEVQRSYYIDMKYGLNYFQYVSKELIQTVGKMFNFPTDREHTFVAGLSMGGYGALKCALTRPEQYRACAAFSAVCDIQNTIDNAMPAARLDELRAILGMDLKIDDCNNLYKLAEKTNKAEQKPGVFMTCGTDDMLYPQNIELKKHLEGLSYNYEFNEWKGDHTWDFWDKSIQLALNFFLGDKISGTKTPLSDGIEKK